MKKEYKGFLGFMKIIFGESEPIYELVKEDGGELIKSEIKEKIISLLEQIPASGKTVSRKPVDLVKKHHGFEESPVSIKQLAEIYAVTNTTIIQHLGEIYSKCRGGYMEYYQLRNLSKKDFRHTRIDLLLKIKRLCGRIRDLYCSNQKLAKELDAYKEFVRSLHKANATVLSGYSLIEKYDEKERMKETPNRSIEDCDFLSFRARNSLKNLEIELFGDLTEKTETELLAVRDLGKKTLDEIKQALGKEGLSLKQV